MQTLQIFLWNQSRNKRVDVRLHIAEDATAHNWIQRLYDKIRFYHIKKGIERNTKSFMLEVTGVK